MDDRTLRLPLVFALFWTSACATAGVVDPPLVHPLPPAEASRFTALRETARKRTPICHEWRADWTAIEVRIKPYEGKDRSRIEDLLARYPAPSEEGYAAWKIYASHRAELDTDTLPVLNWIEGYSSFVSCATVVYWNAMKALLRDSDSLEPVSSQRLLTLVRTSYSRLFGKSGLAATPVDFRIYIALLEIANDARIIRLSTAALSDLAEIKATERELTHAFQTRQGELENRMADQKSGKDVIIDPLRFRDRTSVDAYREFGQEAFTYEEKIHEEIYPRLREWVAKWISGTDRS